MPEQDLTQLLRNWQAGDPEALGKIMPMVYPTLRRIASAYLSREVPGRTLQATALVHEAYLELAEAHGIPIESRSHFLGIAARVMRRILVEAARKRAAQKRGGGWERVELNDELHGLVEDSRQVLALDDALYALAALDERKSRILEMKYFGGLSKAEIGEALGISQEAVGREMVLGLAWLQREMKRGNQVSGNE